MPDSVKQESDRLWNEAHAAYQVLGRAINASVSEKQLQALKDDWQAKHRAWWTHLQRQILKKPGIIMDSVDLAGPDPLTGR